MQNHITDQIAVTIDGKTVRAPKGSTVLQAAQQAGVYIPTLCYLENLEPYGGCRLCMVKIKNMGGFPTACTTPISQNMEVVTNSATLQNLRREILKLILSEHPYTCLVCQEKHDCLEYMKTTRKVSIATGCNFCANNGHCEIQGLVKYLDLTEVAYPISYRGLPPIKDNPFYELDYNLCVLCGRCVRICNEERNSHVLSFVNRGASTVVGTPFQEPQKDAGCEYCGACVDVCPTGAIIEKLGKWAGIPDRSTETTCPYCSVGCAMNINTRGKRIVNVGPIAGEEINPPQLCVRGKFTVGDIAHHPQRITTPLIRKDDKWLEVGWEEAINFAVSNLERYRGSQFAAIGSSHSTMEDNYVLQKFARTVMRSNSVDLFSVFPNKEILGRINDYYRHYSPPQLDDIEDADLIFIFGAQPAQTHPMVENRIRKAARRGKQIVVAHPYPTRTSGFAERTIMCEPGEESYLISSILAAQGRQISRDKVAAIEPLIEDWERSEAQTVLNPCGVTRGEVEELVQSLLRAEKTIIIVGDGVLNQPQNLNSFNALYNLHNLMPDPRNCRIMFLLGEGNHYGSALMGMHPYYLPDFDLVNDGRVLNKWKRRWRTELNSVPGFTTDKLVDNIDVTGITALYLAGDIPAHPNLKDLKFIIQQNMFLTEASRYANLFLPLTSFAETDGHLLSLEGKVKPMNAAIAPIPNAEPTWSVLAKIARGMLEDGFDYHSPRQIFEEIASFVDVSISASAKKNGKLLPIEGCENGKHWETQLPLVIENNHFHYLGNMLSSLIDDMAAIRDEGMLHISPELAEQLGFNGDRFALVRTEFGEAKFPLKISPELAGKRAYFRPNWQHVPEFSQTLNINRSSIQVEIERIENG
ncbi:MAG: molybdopterin-dependent oxidoreductase [candidate division Zixibacteria bacterium]|nr:molybdopterin-dependent oxidoreductase [candidate division Zixibacteria bacterium]